MEVGATTLPVGARHFHISAPDPQSSLVLAIPITITDNSGVAHVLEHLLLTGSKKRGEDGLFFRTRASSSAVDMNAITNSRYLAVHFTCEDAEEYSLLMKTFVTALFEPNWSNAQLSREIATITNEMEGALSDASFNWQLKSYQSLFVEGSGQFNPGGDPSCIASVNQQGLLAFWKEHFSPKNLIAISYGSQAVELISEQLSLELSQFDGGREKKITPSKLTELPRSLNWLGSSEYGLENRSASAILIGSNADKDTQLTIALIRSFIHKYEKDVVKALEQSDVDFQGSLGLRQMDGDGFLFLLSKNGDISCSKKVWDQVAAICEAIINTRSKIVLRRLTHVALGHYFTLGNAKFGTGVAASIELLNAACGSSFGNRQNDGMIDIEAQIDKYQDHSSWIHLIDKNIRMNGSQSLVVCDQSASPRASQLSNSDRHGNLMHKESKLMEIRSLGGRVKNPYLSQGPILGIQENWLVPNIRTHKQNTIFYYRLPRPWISRVKLTTPLPNKLIDQFGPSDQFLLPAVSTSGSQLHQLQASVTASKLSGSPACRLYLSLSSTGDISHMHEKLQFLSSPLWLDQMAEGFDQSDKSGAGARRSLPLHKLAIYRSASRLSTIARVKLALAGYGETSNASSPEWGLSAEQYASIYSQPRSILFIDSAFEETEVDLGVSDAHAVCADDIDFVDDSAANRLADTVRQEIIPGPLNYCARVWTLDKLFGASAEEDAIAHVFSALVTNCFLEPVLRAERSAYAASAEIDSELGMLVMFSYRDPNSVRTDAFFLHAVEQMISGDFETESFEQSKKRAISRLQEKGSYDQRCEKQFDRLVRGYGSDYFDALQTAITTMELSRFKNKLPGFFEGSMTAEYALIGSDGGIGE